MAKLRPLIPLLLGALVGIAYPLIDLAVACRLPSSEACVWGKSYLPLTIALSLVLLGGATAALTYALLRWRRNRGGRPV